MEDFYAQTLRRLLREKWIALDSTVLVICGGRYDRDTFHTLGFHNVTISNLDSRLTGDEFAPYPWSPQDAESLTFRDNEFDFVVVHQGLHHCYSPHRGLLQMYRVARCGILVFEPRDTRLVRLGIRLGFGQQYEVAAVAGNGLKYGGVGNTATPNFVYRWSEPEIEKTINSYSPIGRAKFRYFFALRIPEGRLKSMKNRFVARTVQLLLPAARIFTTLFPRQSNCFAFAIAKPEALHPWLARKDDAISLNEDWFRKHYAIGVQDRDTGRDQEDPDR
jgi:SAM-dependent methyltransferase